MNRKSHFLKLLAENPSIVRYKALEQYIENNEEVQSLFNDLKRIQKQLVNAREHHKHHAFDGFTKQYNETLEAIHQFPLVVEYLALQSDINEMLQSIMTIIEEGLIT